MTSERYCHRRLVGMNSFHADVESNMDLVFGSRGLDLLGPSTEPLLQCVSSLFLGAHAVTRPPPSQIRPLLKA